ncbi:putative dynamin GTPase effector, Dynamin superfamily [Helianthus annuus]|nr:putative dynamin GTPase effector, Dynamin superfamily [Helianthus annuus]KAJ0641950.1 putative dynamin GTPase effector, Dynamin superfamily [Helianthus annuus]
MEAGGDRIYGVFDHQLPGALRKLPFDKHLSLQNVRKLVSEADGYQPHLVHFVLKELVRKSIGETAELRRFPTLQSALAAAAGEALEKFHDESKMTVVRLLPQEGEKMGPTPSPGDCRTSSADRRNPPGSDRGVPGADRVIPSNPLLDQYAEAHFRRIGLNVSSIGMVSDTLRSTIPKAVIYCQVKEAKQNLLNYFYTQIGRREVTLALQFCFV